MVSDSVNVSLSYAPSGRDFGKKKRANRTAKLKQCKLDARREQWLSSQGSVKDKEFKDGTNRARMPIVLTEGNPPLDDLEIRRRGHGIADNVGSINRESDSESPSNSPTSSLLAGTHSGTNFIGSSGSSSSSSSGGCCSGNITEEEECYDDDCLDDWEAVADALVASDNRESRYSCQELPQERLEPLNSKSSTGVRLGLENTRQEGPKMVLKSPIHNRAWRPDDAFRPQSLPSLMKLQSFPNTDRHFGHGRIPWIPRRAANVPSSCPICYENMDLTDSSFLPCLCGFMLCLFCHKRILEGDGRCPGCRKPYEHNAVESESTLDGHSLTLRLGRCSSMLERS